MGWVVNATPRPFYPREREPVPIVQEAGWASEPVWTGAENLASTGTRSPDRPARSESLYRLSYPGSLNSRNKTYKCTRVKYVVSHIINNQHVSIALAIIIRVALQEDCQIT
jgi:hypothetical protein